MLHSGKAGVDWTANSEGPGVKENGRACWAEMTIGLPRQHSSGQGAMHWP